MYIIRYSHHTITTVFVSIFLFLTIILSVTLVLDEEDFVLDEYGLFGAIADDDDNEDVDEDMDAGDVCIGIPFGVAATPEADIVITLVGDIADVVDDVPFTAAVTPLITAASCDETFGAELFPL